MCFVIIIYDCVGGFLRYIANDSDGFLNEKGKLYVALFIVFKLSCGAMICNGVVFDYYELDIAFDYVCLLRRSISSNINNKSNIIFD